MYAKGTTTPVLPEYAVIDVGGGVAVGVIGAVTRQTPSLVSPGGVETLDFGDPVDAVNRVAAQLSDGDPPANGEADVIVAEYHEGADTVTADSTLDSEIAESPTFAKIVNETSPEVDVIFNGHTHQPYAWQAPVTGAEAASRPVVQAGNYGERIGEVTLHYDRDRGGRDGLHVEGHRPHDGRRHDARDDLPARCRSEDDRRRRLAQAAVIGNQTIGSITADITTAFTGTTRDDRASESTLGGLVANSLRDSLASSSRGGAQIGVVNPGGLRADLLYAPDGAITYAEANNVLPFLNNLWTTTLTAPSSGRCSSSSGSAPRRASRSAGGPDRVRTCSSACRTT